MVVSALLRHRARSGRLREIHARLRKAHLADRLAALGLRRRHIQPHGRGLRQPGSRRHRDPQLSMAPGSGRRGEVRRAGEAARPVSEHYCPEHHARRRCQRRATSRPERLREEVLRQVSSPQPHRRHRPQPATGGSAGIRPGDRRRRRVGEGMKTGAMLLAGLLGFASTAAAQRFDGANAWLNSPPLAAAELRGKVVLVDFWTYTCINWLHTLPYVRAWAEKYKDHG